MELGTGLANLGAKGSALVKRLTRRSSSNFKFAFLFLGAEQRAALERVYEFCRIVDDIVDERPPGPQGEREAARGLQLWRDEVAALYAAGSGRAALQTELGPKLAESIPTFDLPRAPFDEIIEGCAMDLERDAYATLEELELYCYRVASCVGLLCIGIFGDQGPAAQRYARHLGLALQYTNILRDVGEDAARGRVYLPEDLLARHGLGRDDVLACRYDANFIAAAAEFAAIAEREYQAAWRAFEGVDNRRGLMPAEIMGRTYYEILTEIRGYNYNVFTRRAALRRRDKLKVAAQAIARTNLPSALAPSLRP